MRRRSKLIERLKQEELNRYRDLSVAERVNLGISHSEFIRFFFNAGLRYKGFSEKEISFLWQKKDRNG